MSAVPVATVRAYLGLDASDDAALQLFVSSAEDYCARKIGGPLAPTAVTQRADGLGASLVLTSLPVISVTSVTGADGGTLVVANLDVDLERGLVGFTPVSRVIFPMNWYTVVYQAGYATLPDDLIQAVKSRSAYYWATQRGPRDQNDDAEAERIRADGILAQFSVYGFA